MSGSSAGAALLAAVVLDGIPENLALGTTLAAGSGSGALLAAIFRVELPRGAGRRADDVRERPLTPPRAGDLARRRRRARCGGGRGRAAAFAGGAVLASLTITLFPKAYADGGPWVAAATVAGFLFAFTLGTLGAKG